MNGNETDDNEQNTTDRQTQNRWQDRHNCWWGRGLSVWLSRFHEQRHRSQFTHCMTTTLIYILLREANRKPVPALRGIMKFGLDAVEQLEVSNAAIPSSPLSSSYLRLNDWDWKTVSLLLGRVMMPLIVYKYSGRWDATSKSNWVRVVGTRRR